MAKAVAKLTVVLSEPQEKKNVTRYDCEGNEEALTTVYVRKEHLKKIGNPKKIKVTIEAA